MYYYYDYYLSNGNGAHLHEIARTPFRGTFFQTLSLSLPSLTRESSVYLSETII